METHRNELWSKTSLCVCSYLKSLGSRRASIVRGAMQSWDQFLELPFKEKIFLDDGSPDVNGIQMLKLSQNLNKFDEVRYNTLIHPPHCNFGTVASMSLCRNEYIMHIDDDIYITGSYQDCFKILERSLEVLDKDENILGINLLTMSNQFEKEWLPGKDYSSSDDFAHPNKYFGSAVSLIRKNLLEKIGWTDIIQWGAQQPANWEILLSDDASSFLVTKAPTPFGIDMDSWLIQSTSENISLKVIKYDLYKKFPWLKNLSSLLIKKDLS
jgi:hypothetical protein